uniref:Uncharacterized protein n=1 Tax=Candidatus Kentrum sp. DK TaxID=2126562 RepID=A0A450T9L6_9GAMM|nr:MAG: hypothetical protein BECKDK2373B_GA0170837_11257 [Candidatus Kentron sp. DK]
MAPVSRTISSRHFIGTAGGKRRILPALLLLLPLILLLQHLVVPASLAVEKSASYSARVEAGKWKTIRLRNLVKGATLGVRVSSTGSVGVLLARARESVALSDIRHPLFRGKTTNRLNFSVVIPDSGHYYLVIDNRAGNAARRFTVDVKAVADIKTALNVIDAKLAVFVKVFKQVFDFESLSIHTAVCGDRTDFSDADAVLICAEDATLFTNALGDRETAKKALMFRMMRGMSRVLLKEWGYPSEGILPGPGRAPADNAMLADEFATVLAVILGQAQETGIQARAIVSRTGKDRSGNPRLPSAGVARQVLDWLESPDGLVQKWQNYFLPHMKTRFLEGLRRRPKPWISPESIRRELEQRKIKKIEV